MIRASIKTAIAAAAIVTGFMLETPAIAQTVAPGTLPAGIYVSDETHTSVTFKVSHMGMSNYTARFAKADAELNFDPADPTKSTLKASVDPASIRTDYPHPDKKDFDKELATDADRLTQANSPPSPLPRPASRKPARPPVKCMVTLLSLA